MVTLDKFAELVYLAVDASLRCSGVGTVLLRAVMAEVLSETKNLFLVTAPTPSAVPFYEKHGFRDEEILDSKPLPDRWLCHVMQYRPVSDA